MEHAHGPPGCTRLAPGDADEAVEGLSFQMSVEAWKAGSASSERASQAVRPLSSVYWPLRQGLIRASHFTLKFACLEDQSEVSLRNIVKTAQVTLKET